MNTRVEAPNRALREPAVVIGSLVQLTKPGVTRLVIVTTWFGAVLAPGVLDPWLTALTLVGTVLVVASANALNMYLEQDVDALMERTRNRPLPAGRLSRDVALGFGLALGLGGLLVLFWGVNLLTTMLAAFSLLTYVLLYTPMKARSSLALYVGAVPGAMPPVLGYTGLSGELTAEACAAFAVLFTWQIPHFLAITVFRRAEYAAAGLQVMSVAHGQAATVRAIVWWSLALLLVTVLPWAVGLGGSAYLFSAVVCGGAFLAWALFGRAGRELERWARSLFFASMPYLVVLFTLLGFTAP